MVAVSLTMAWCNLEMLNSLVQIFSRESLTTRLAPALTASGGSGALAQQRFQRETNSAWRRLRGLDLHLSPA